MQRTLTLFLLALLLMGCTRHGTRAAGPFAHRPKADPAGQVPPAPRADSSPLVIPDARPEPPRPADDARRAAVSDSDRPPVVPAGGPVPDAPAPNPAAKALADLKAVTKVATDRWAKITDYEAVVTRRELNPKGEMSSEVVLYQFRKEPMGLFTRTLSDAGKNREMVYSPAKHGDKLHLMIGEGDSRLMKAGFKPGPISPDDNRVKEKARYSVREAGFGFHLARVADWAAKVEAGKLPADALTVLGPAERSEVKRELVGVRVTLKAGDDPMLPTGGVREWWFDLKADSPSYGMPILITAADPKGKEVEFYVFEQFKAPAGLTDADFSPERLGKKK